MSVAKESWIGDRVEGGIKKMQLNNYILSRFVDVQNLLLKLKLDGKLAELSDKQLKSEINLLIWAKTN